jgi:hypothetical protein
MPNKRNSLQVQLVTILEYDLRSGLVLEIEFACETEQDQPSRLLSAALG